MMIKVFVLMLSDLQYRGSKRTGRARAGGMGAAPERARGDGQPASGLPRP